MNILAIETSCDETSVAIVRDGRTVLSNVIASQIGLHRRYGGVVPELAARQHIITLIPTLDEAFRRAGVDWDAIDAIAVTCGPGLAGALLVGLNAAKALAFGRDKPLIAVNHLEAHIYSNWVIPGDADRRGPAGALARGAAGAAAAAPPARRRGARSAGRAARRPGRGGGAAQRAAARRAPRVRARAARRRRASGPERDRADRPDLPAALPDRLGRAHRACLYERLRALQPARQDGRRRGGRGVRQSGAHPRPALPRRPGDPRGSPRRQSGGDRPAARRAAGQLRLQLQRAEDGDAAPGAEVRPAAQPRGARAAGGRGAGAPRGGRGRPTRGGGARAPGGRGTRPAGGGSPGPAGRRGASAARGRGAGAARGGSAGAARGGRGAGPPRRR